jgi:hypothetical protein
VQEVISLEGIITLEGIINLFRWDDYFRICVQSLQKTLGVAEML